MLIVIWTIVFVLLGVLAGTTGNMYFLGAAFLILGALFFYLIYMGMARDAKALILSGIYVTIWGVLIIGASLTKSEYEAWIFAEGFGGAFLGLGIYQGVIKAVTCKEKITACFMGAKTRSAGRGGSFYEPVFAFVYQKRQYQGTTGEVYRWRKLIKRYQEGNWYSIYINPGNPNVMCTKRYPQSSAVVMMGIGIVCMGIPFFSMC